MVYADKRAIVVGGSSGIGLATARLLRERAARVTIAGVCQRIKLATMKRAATYQTATEASEWCRIETSALAAMAAK